MPIDKKKLLQILNKEVAHSKNKFLTVKPRHYHEEQAQFGAYLQISIYPETENLRKAALILAEIFEDYAFKCLVLNGEFKLKPFQVAWTEESTNFDHDDLSSEQRGSEFIVVVNLQDKDQLQMQMLRAWRALQDAGIRLCYYKNPNDQAIMVDNYLPTPFSLASDSPSIDLTFTTLHITSGGIDISRELQSMIEYLQIKKQELRNDIKAKWLERANKELNYITELKGKYEKVEELWNSSKLDDLGKYIHENAEVFMNFAKYFPRDTKDMSALTTEAANYLRAVNVVLTQHYPQTSVLKAFKENLEQLVANNFELFKKLTEDLAPKILLNGLIREELKSLGSLSTNYLSLMAENPAETQLIFVKLLEYIYVQEQLEVQTRNLEIFHLQQEQGESNLWKEYGRYMFLHPQNCIRVNLSYSNLDNSFAEELLKIIPQCTNLISVNLKGNPIDGDYRYEIDEAIRKNRLARAMDIFIKIYQPELDFIFILPEIKNGQVIPIVSQNTRLQNFRLALTTLFDEDWSELESLFNQVYQEWQNKTDLTTLRNKSAYAVSSAILDYIIKHLDGKVGFQGECFEYQSGGKIKKLYIAKHVAKALDFLVSNGGAECPPEVFIKACYDNVINAAPATQTTILNIDKVVKVIGILSVPRTAWNQRHPDVILFDEWLKALGIPKGGFKEPEKKPERGWWFSFRK